MAFFVLLLMFEASMPPASDGVPILGKKNLPLRHDISLSYTQHNFISYTQRTLLSKLKATLNDYDEFCEAFNL